MKWVDLNSTAIAGASYNDEIETLYVRFHNGVIVPHRHITKGIYDNLVNAGDPGFYYDWYIAPEPRKPSYRWFWRFLTVFVLAGGGIGAAWWTGIDPTQYVPAQMIDQIMSQLGAR